MLTVCSLPWSLPRLHSTRCNRQLGPGHGNREGVDRDTDMERTPRAPARAHLSLLPSGPGEGPEVTPHEGAAPSVSDTWTARATRGRDDPSAAFCSRHSLRACRVTRGGFAWWPRAHGWKACWGQPLRGSNPLS